MNIPLQHKEFFTHKKNDIWFTIIGVILLVVLIWMFIASIRFLSVSVDGALDEENKNTPPASFNLGALEGLGIIQTATPATSSASSVSE